MSNNKNLGIKFSKYNSCGNDFIIVDNRQLVFPLKNQEFSCSFLEKKHYIESICDRKKSIGADGFILLCATPEKASKPAVNYLFQPASDSIRLTNQSLYVMVYFNSDGNVSSFCGNGSMCCAHFAATLGLCADNSDTGTFIHRNGLFSFDTNINNGKTRISMVNVKDYHIDQEGILMDTGSPHYVLFVPNLDSVDVNSEGEKIRYSNRFSAKGVNVTFASFIEDKLFIRTYERGVERETLSCGTGAVAAALSASIYNLISDNTIAVQTKGGLLEVSFKKNNKSFTGISLESVVEKNFEGILPNM